MAEINLRSKKPSPRIDMTPMVDLAFLLLTFFMLTAAFYKPFVMEIRMPEKPEKTDPPKEINQNKVITLLLGENDKVYWYKGKEAHLAETDYSANGIRKTLLHLKASITGMVVIIKPSDESRYQNIVDILDEMTIAGISTYYLVDITHNDINLLKP